MAIELENLPTVVDPHPYGFPCSPEYYRLASIVIQDSSGEPLYPARYPKTVVCADDRVASRTVLHVLLPTILRQ
jgi:hypothetical protein